MRRMSSVVLLLALLAFAEQASAITKEEVMTLARLKIPDQQIIDAIKKDRTVFVLQIQDILELKKAGVSDEVIKFMLKTKTLFGGEGRAEKAAAKKTARKKTPEEIRKEQERKRLEEERRREEERRAMMARRKAYARGILRQGLALAEEGKWVKAVQVFQDFLAEGNYGPGTEDFYNAKYGIATALVKAGLYQAAARTLVEVLLEGPDKPFFVQAFRQLRSLRKQIIYNPPDLRELTRFSYARFSQRFQDEVNYVLGDFFYDFGNYQRALKHFKAISDGSPEKPKALYLTGLIQVRYKMYKSAVESFEQVIETAERLGSKPAVVELAYMALARIAFEAADYDAAMYYYRKVPSDSPRASRVFYEMAWTYLMKGDYSRALGAFHALHSPYFARTFYPELWILEARVFSDLCRYDAARQALKQFDTKVAPLLLTLKTFMKAQRSPADYYKHFVASMNGDLRQKALPLVLGYPVLSNVEFYNVYLTIEQIEKEIEEIRARRGELGNFAKEMLTKLAMLHKDRVFEAGVKIQQVLKGVENDLMQSQVRATEIEVDIENAAIQQMTKETQLLVGGVEEEQKSEAPKAKEGAIAVIGSDTEVWSFEGEYWQDEIPYYRSMLTSKCTQ